MGPSRHQAYRRQPKQKTYRLSDEKGLYLELQSVPLRRLGCGISLRIRIVPREVIRPYGSL
jgi:hypothetical protein